MATNWMRGTLRVLPICVPYDIEGINTLKDIAVITGTDVISSLKGELISTVNFHDIVEIPKFIYGNNQLVIENNSTSIQVKRHVQDLKKLILESLESEKRKILSNRIRGLLSRCVYIKLDDSLFEKKGIYIDRLEMGVKMSKDISRFGLVDLKSISSENAIIDSAINTMISRGFQKISFIALCEALKRAISISRTLGNCSTMILCKN
tara:strand:- start:206 stop:826 length:621 start_codon:yes stop_codon:yes gene_type:complete